MGLVDVELKMELDSWLQMIQKVALKIGYKKGVVIDPIPFSISPY